MTGKKQKRNSLLALLRYIAVCGVGFFVWDCSDRRPEPCEREERRYVSSTDTLPFSFLIPEESTLLLADSVREGRIFLDVVFPREKARLYGTYHPLLENSFAEHSEESRKLVYFHALKADAIREEFYENPTAQVYGLFYTLEGPVATPLQFSLSDSQSYFFHGSLYFNEGESKEEKGDTIQVLQQDLRKLMETFKHHPRS